MKSVYAKRQHGAALLAMLVVLALGATWYLVSRLNADSSAATATRKVRNAEVLNRAKQALIGYVAMQAAEAGERNPGRLPCPEGANFIGDNEKDGISAPTVGAPTCASIGRLPWRTLGLDKLVDTAGEPLWYVVGPSWRLTTTTSTLLINSNTPSGDITVDGQQTVALIVAPGAAMNVQTSAGCTARNQARSAPSPTMDALDYIECFDSATLQFVTTASSTSFNDQVVRITVADIMPAIEAAIANRIEREIVPALKTVYTPATWGFSGSNPVLPLAAPFANPGPGAGTSSYQGASASYAGLLPFNRTQACTESASDLRCTTVTTGTSATTGLPAFLVFSKFGNDTSTGSGSINIQSTCSWQANVYVCTGLYNAPSISVTFKLNVTNVTMGLRALDPTKVTCTAVDDVGAGLPTQTVPCSVTAALQANGSVIVTVTTSALPDVASSGWTSVANYKINIDRAAIGDHALLNPVDPVPSTLCPATGCTGWFVRNEWYRLLYYAVSQSNTAVKVATERSCSALPTDCLTVTTNVTPSSNSALLILAGRSINGTTRPSSTPRDYLEFGNAKSTPTFERQTVTPAGPSPYVDAGTANAYDVPVASLTAGTTFQFKAVNSNTGTSTLTTPATGLKNLVNLDGSNLAASTIQANAVVQVAYDGTKFLLSKRPFNDRIVIIGSN